jgi:molybdate transport system substrate-binding protein
VSGNVRVLSAGAAKAVVQSLGQSFGDAAGVSVTATFDAAGAIRAQFLRDRRCDVVILPTPMQDALAAEGIVEACSVKPLGRVDTCVAVPRGAPWPPIGSAQELRSALLRAPALYCPDVERSTAGIHFMKMLVAMAIDTNVRANVRAYANGAAAMTALAAADAPAGALGCTQATEILYTDGVSLVGPLPAPFELATIYSVAVSAAAANREAAKQFAALLWVATTRALREAKGFAQ